MAAMNSSLYECHVSHARFEPQRHAFAYRVFFFALDLDEVETAARRAAFFSAEKWNVFSFRDRDFFPTPDAGSLKQRVTAHAARHGVDLQGGRVVLVTLPRVLGYLFNPVSFYFCYDRAGAMVAVIAEVTNTFREVKPYFIRDPKPCDGEFRLRIPKHFYVSPFSDVDVCFDFAIRPPGERLAIRIDDYNGRRRTLASRLSGVRRELTGRRLAWFAVKYPLLSLRIITLIHWHALRLWLKRVPWFAKAARASEQRGLFRPHHSLNSIDAA